MARTHEEIAASIASAAVAHPDTIVKAQRGGGAAHVIVIAFTPAAQGGGLLVGVHGESATSTDEASRVQLGAFTGQIARYVEAMLGGAPVAVV